MNLLPLNAFWERPDEDDPPLPGVPDAALRAWENRHKLAFPARLWGPYLEQNGGLIRHGDVHLLPLESITWLDAHVWNLLTEALPALTDVTRAIHLAGEEETIHFLYYPEEANEPRLYCCSFYTDVITEDPVPLSVFLDGQLAATSEPGFAWSETEQGERLFAETLPGVSGLMTPTEQVVIRRGTQLFFYERHDDSMQKEVLTLPINPDACEISRQTWRGYNVWELGFFSEQEGGENLIYTEQCDDGMWKTTVTPDNYTVTVESRSRANIDQLLNALFDAPTVRRMQRRRRRDLYGAILLGAFMFVIVLPLIITLLAFSMVMRLLTWPIRVFRRRRRSQEPPFPPRRWPRDPHQSGLIMRNAE